MGDCRCQQLPEIIRGHTENPPVEGLVEVDRGSDGWISLYRCPTCGQHWQIDVWDKYQIDLTIKIDDPANWSSFDDKPMRLQHLINARGGLWDKTCLWSGCQAPALNGLVFCPHHAYSEMGLHE